jgi:hypothetical protein
MFGIAATVVISAVIARVTTVILNDRPSSPPRSHDHEVDPFYARA